jgi:long-chain acyl-CoA synthetase
VIDLPDRRERASPDAPCVADLTTDLTNARFAAGVRRAAGVLRAHGIGESDVVAIALSNRIELITALFASWRIGAVVTPVNPALTAIEMQRQLDDSGARLVVIETSLDSSVRALVPEDLSEGTEDDSPVYVASDDTLALLIYTSGTTGTPKGVMLSHGNLAAMCEGVCQALELSSDDHSLLILPLFHVNGICVGTLSPLLAGGRVTVAPRFSASSFLDTVAQTRPTYFSAVPAIYTMLSALPQTTPVDTSSLRLVVCGAAPMPAELIVRIEQRFGVVLLEGYGLSEATCASTLNPLHGPHKPGTVGLPLPRQEVVVLDADGDPLPPGRPGEVAIKGPTVMQGYLGRPEETAQVLREGWLRTGDVGVFDEDGYLRLVDRIKDLIIRGGENIYPKEIENVLYSDDGVLETAVIGRADQVLGEVPVAYVVFRSPNQTSLEKLGQLCAQRLARYKQPAEFVLIDALPKNPVGKIDKPALRRSDAARAVVAVQG